MRYQFDFDEVSERLELADVADIAAAAVRLSSRVRDSKSNQAK